jgi:hypothetical protein
VVVRLGVIGMSLNDLVTAIVALTAVLVPFAALVISDAVDKRAARSTLTDLAVKINKKAAAYDKLFAATQSAQAAADRVQNKGNDDLYTRVKELEMLVSQADFLVNRLKPGVITRWIPQLGRRPRYPSSVAITLAQALESAEDPWWADRYWRMGIETHDPHERAWAYTYWAVALCGRYEYKCARKKVAEGLEGFTSQTADACIFRGDIYATIIPFDSDNSEWSADALREYRATPKNDEQYKTAEDRIKRVTDMMDMMTSIGQSEVPDVMASSAAGNPG